MLNKNKFYAFIRKNYFICYGVNFFKPLLLIIALLAANVFALSGCASMFGDNTRAITVKSHPSGASVYIDNIKYGTTPSVINLNSWIYGGKIIVFKKPGYEDTVMVVNTKFQPVSILNIFNGLLGITIDGLTGNLVKIDPAYLAVDVELQRNNSKIAN